MAFKQKLAKASGIAAAKLPASYQIIGDVLLFKLPGLSQEKKEQVAAATMALLPYVKTVCEIKEVRGELRQPLVVKLTGKSTVTIHKENDILYKLDAAQIMFSKGNLAERKRLIPLIKEGEIVIDMFAGIGYFSLGIAKFAQAREIMAIEKNPLAYDFLTENIVLNKINNINAIQGDCKLFALSFPSVADRIIMGYFPGTEEFLPYALHMARSNCTIHFHNIYKIKDLWKKPLQQIEEACQKANVKYEILAKKKVKSYSPSMLHVVIDFKVVK